MAHKKNKPKRIKEPATPQDYMGCPDPNPDTPEGMAFILSAGFVDPRPGGYPQMIHPNQQLVLIQSWVPTAKLWWELGLRWHPELATKWVAHGGGQFSASPILSEDPGPPQTFEEVAQEMVDDQFPNLMKEVERVRDHGTDAEKEAMRAHFARAQQQVTSLAEAFDTKD